MSLQAAIPEGDSEEEPLKPTSHQVINYKIKKLRDLKEKFEKLKSSIQKENAQRFTKNSGKIISGQECGQGFNEKLRVHMNVVPRSTINTNVGTEN